jgi:hypothetical protein
MTHSATDATEVDWSIIEAPGVLDLLGQVSRKLAGQFASVTSADDLEQEGMILLATNGETVRGYLADDEHGMRHLHRWLWSRLYDRVRTPAARAGRSISWEQWAAPSWEDDAEAS